MVLHDVVVWCCITLLYGVALCFCMELHYVVVCCCIMLLYGVALCCCMVLDYVANDLNFGEILMQHCFAVSKSCCIR